MAQEHWSVGILLFDDVEVLDFAGPFEVFSVTMLENGERPFSVRTFSESGKTVRARGGLSVTPNYSFETMPRFDLLVVPGGSGAREREIHNKKVIRWLADEIDHVQIITSVCTGALLLAEAGLLDGKRATTHWASLDRLENDFPAVHVVRKVKYVDEGSVVTSGGISAGINMAFHLVARLTGEEAARATAKRMEFDIDF